jgi:polysaccharide export outer membrane protein
LGLGGCATLPSSGPTANQILKHANGGPAEFNFRVVNLDPPAIMELGAEESKLEAAAQTLSALTAEHRSDLIGPGDTLSINIYEVGVSLFSGGGSHQSGGSGGGGFDPSAHSESFPAIMVNAQGAISLPKLNRACTESRRSPRL